MENPDRHCCTELTPKLSMDLIDNILVRLPPKPLARFKCVSKPWYSLINAPHFIIRHVNHSFSTFSNLHLALFSHSSLHSLHLPSLDSSPPHKIPLPFSSQSFDSDLFGSCNGLLGISDFPKFVALFSPTTKTHRVISFDHSLHRQVEAHWVDFGLGYDNAAHDFKVVRVDQLNGPGSGSRPTRDVRVFSLKEGFWRKLDVGFPHFLAHPKGHGKFLNNSLHWMCSVNKPKVYDLNTLMRYPQGADKTVYNYVIVAFDVTNDMFSVIEMPLFDGTGVNKKVFPRPWLAILGSNLVVQIEYGPLDRRIVDVWLMREYGVKDSWVKLLTFPYREARPDTFGRVNPLAMCLGKESSEVLMEQNGAKKHYFWYNLANGKYRDVEICGVLPNQFAWIGGHPCEFGAVLYVGSLVALDNVGLERAEVREESDSGAEHAQNEIPLPRMFRIMGVLE